jgi:plastocyanin
MTSQIWTRQPLTVLSNATIAAVLVSFIGFIALQLSVGLLIPPVLIVMLGELVVIALIATGWLWATVLGAMVGLGTIIGGVGAQPYAQYHLEHPDVFFPFASLALVVLAGIAAIVVGIAATLQNYRHERATPRWLAGGTTALAGIFAGMLIASAIATAIPASATARPASGTPAVHLEAASFAPDAVIVPRGGKLHVVADSNILHILANGTWQGQRPHPGAESGAPKIANVQIAGGAADLGPFTTSGTYHIYCTVHPGMTLTVFVP